MKDVGKNTCFISLSRADLRLGSSFSQLPVSAPV